MGLPRRYRGRSASLGRVATSFACPGHTSHADAVSVRAFPIIRGRRKCYLTRNAIAVDPLAPKPGAPMLAQFPDKLPAAVMVALETMYSRHGVETAADVVTFSVALGKYTTPVRVVVLDEVKATLPVVVPANNTP